VRRVASSLIKFSGSTKTHDASLQPIVEQAVSVMFPGDDRARRDPGKMREAQPGLRDAPGSGSSRSSNRGCPRPSLEPGTGYSIGVWAPSKAEALSDGP
jgi:hypothetical protein